MKQLDFSAIPVVHAAALQANYDAFWGPLNPSRRTAARVACDFFLFATEANRQMAVHDHCEKSDPKKSSEGFRRAQLYSKIAVEKFHLFGRLTGCTDDAEAIDRLDKLIAHSQKTGWRIYPVWWTKLPEKNTAYFITRLKNHAGQYLQYLAISSKGAGAKSPAKGKTKGGAK